MSEIRADETYIRQYIDLYNLDDLLDLLEQKSFSLNLLREFQDRINWKIIFEKAYFHWTMRTSSGKYL